MLIILKDIDESEFIDLNFIKNKISKAINNCASILSIITIENFAEIEDHIKKNTFRNSLRQ